MEFLKGTEGGSNGTAKRNTAAQGRRCESMKLHWKAGVPALVFTAVFLLLPGFRAGWPGVWAVASLCIWLPAYVWDERHSPRCKAAVSLLLCGADLLLILLFTAENSLMHQLPFYLCICIRLCTGFLLKILWVKHIKAHGQED